MSERYMQAIVQYLDDKHYQPTKVRQLARRMGVADNDYAVFRDSVKQLHDSGRVVMGPKNVLSLPAMGSRVVGVYRGSARGFGFITPSEPNTHGDLYVPAGENLDAVTGDTVLARVIKRGKQAGKMIYQGRIVNVVARGNSRFVGELARAEKGEPFWFVSPQGRNYTDPIVIDDVGPAGKAGEKVVVEIVRYGSGENLAHGVIVETLGAGGPIDVETLAMIREHGLPDAFEEDVLAEARAAVASFDCQADASDDREDLTDWTVVTIDPVSARDYDDAISITPRKGGGFRLGVHIADVAHFVPVGSALDVEASARGNSVYFPRKVVPMLPEILANGVCSLQAGQVRFVKTALIDYDAEANVVGARIANAKIRSRQRLTYEEAQGILAGNVGGYERPVVDLVRAMETLAKRVEARRRRAGMLHLDLPEVELVFSDAGAVTGVVPADQSYTHTIIEMFMVEANEVSARRLEKLDVPFMRRIHPEGDATATKHLREFVKACGLKIPRDLTRQDMQALIDSVRGLPESYAVNLALLKTFEKAEYSPLQMGHFALASRCYCHFTSPIRRYPDLLVHRLLDMDIRGRLKSESHPDTSALAELGRQCSYTERRAERAGRELRALLVLHMLAEHVGEQFEAVVTGVTSFGVFAELVAYRVEGLIALSDLGDDWWEPDPARGVVAAQRSGRRIQLGDLAKVRIVSVDLARRQMNLALVPSANPKASRKPSKGKKLPAKRGRGGARKPRRRSG